MEDEHSDKSSCNAFSPREENPERRIDRRYFVDLVDSAPSSNVNRAQINVIHDETAVVEEDEFDI